MAIVVRRTPVGLTADQYDEGIRRLADAGLGHPPGRLFHVCFGEPGNLMVSDVWESRETFDKFSENLCPFSKTSASILAAQHSWRYTTVSLAESPKGLPPDYRLNQ